MKKSILAMVLCLASASVALAGDYAYVLQVNQTDGTHVSFLFENSPVARISGSDLEISDDTSGIPRLFPFGEVENLTVTTSILSGMESIGKECDNPAFGLTQSALDLRGIGAGCPVRVNDANGKLVLKGSADRTGSVSLDTSSLPKGLYVVTAGKHSFKFIR